MKKVLWTLLEAWIVALRDLLHWRHQPGAVILGWFFPVMITFMFGSLFGGAFSLPSGAGYFDFLIPGMFVMTMVFGLEATVISVTTDTAKGITDRFRSLPIVAGTVLAGRCIADMLNSIIGLAVMISCGLLLGWRRQSGLGAMLCAIMLLLWLRFALLWMGIYLGILFKGPESVVAVQILVWPIGFLSSIFVDPATMPRWLGSIAQWNPLSSTAAVVRALFGGPGWKSSMMVFDLAKYMAIIWPLLITAIFLPLAVRRYRRLRY